MGKFFKFLVPVAVFVIVGAVALAVYNHFFAEKTQIIFKTEKVMRGELASVISASGTVEPEELVNVGAQVSGKIMSFGTDAEGHKVDYGSRVKAGMLLAQIDDVLYDAELRECKAKKLQADAEIVTAKAQIRQSKARQILAERNWSRAQELYSKKAMAKSDYDAAEASYVSSLADTGTAEAALEQAKAQLAIAEAALIKAQRNMDYCVITSPVDGIIIDRRVSIGQTVVSSMSASSIFLIAKDFKKMQVWVSVNEADIGSIRTGMPVLFTVDTFPGIEFEGTVKKVRLNATMSQNVVTYIVEVNTDNDGGKLIPYLTANVRFIRAKRNNVLQLSGAALRYQPAADLISSDSPELAEGERAVWVDAGNGKLRAVPIRTGLNTGARFEILSGDLKEGDSVVIGVAEVAPQSGAQSGSQSPFMPEPPKRQPRGGSAGQRARAQQSK